MPDAEELTAEQHPPRSHASDSPESSPIERGHERGSDPLHDRLRTAVDGLPDGASLTLPADAVREWLDATPDGSEPDSDPGSPPQPDPVDPAPTWRERIWIVPADTRIGVPELAEALDRPPGWIYRRTQSDADDPIPHRKAGNMLRFRVGEVRHWIREREDVRVAGPVDSTAGERTLTA